MYGPFLNIPSTVQKRDTPFPEQLNVNVDALFSNAV